MKDEPLTVLAEAHFGDKTPPYEWVTFLNKALKRRGYIFGLTEGDGGYALVIYETAPWPDEGPAKD